MEYIQVNLGVPQSIKLWCLVYVGFNRAFKVVYIFLRMKCESVNVCASLKPLYEPLGFHETYF